MDAPEQPGNADRGNEHGFTRYRVPQNVAAIAGNVVVKNDRGRAAFAIDQGTQAADDVVRVRDLSGAYMCFVGGSALRSGGPVEIRGADATTLATLTRVDLSPVRSQFAVRVGPETVWTLEGPVADYDYRICDRGEDIAEVSRRWFRARGTYGVQVAAGQDDLLVLTVAVSLDLLLRAGA